MDNRIAVVIDQIDWKTDVEECFSGLDTAFHVRLVHEENMTDPETDDIVFFILSTLNGRCFEYVSSDKGKVRNPAIVMFLPTEEIQHLDVFQVTQLQYLDTLPFTREKVARALNAVLQFRTLQDDIRQMQNTLTDCESVYRVFVSAGRLMASSLVVEEVLTGIMEAVGSLLQSEAWSVALLDKQTENLVFRAARGATGEKILGASVPCDRSIIGWVFENQKPLIVPDTSRDHRHFKAFDKSSGFSSKSILCMPLRTRDRNLGAIEFINKVGSQFAPEDIDRVQVIMDLAAITLENATMFEELSNIAETDELTGLFNQDSLVRRVENLIDSTMHKNGVFGYIFLDIDYLKRVNDYHGHLSGRAVLREVGHLLRDLLDQSAIVGRYGGDEFWVVLPDTDDVSSMEIAERIRKAIEKEVFLKNRGLNIRLTASMGVVCYPNHADSFDKLALLADKALFLAKKLSRNKVLSAVDVIQSEMS